MSPASWSFVSPDARRGRSLAIIYATVALDAAGTGLVFPILPQLIREVTHSPDVAPYVGWMAALYAVMQFVFAPVLGALSDRLGRRPVLLVALVGAAINYGVMALAPQLWMLMLGRAVAGLTSADMSVATAYMTDITPGEQRARRFGQMGACSARALSSAWCLAGYSANNGSGCPSSPPPRSTRETCCWRCSHCPNLTRHHLPPRSILPRSTRSAHCADLSRCRACCRWSSFTSR
jgi:MFS family permease